VVAYLVMSRQYHMVAVDTELVVLRQSMTRQLHTLVLVPPVSPMVAALSSTIQHIIAHHLLHKHTQLMLKVSTLTQTQQSFVVQLQLVFKPTHKTLQFASFNHHQSHPMAHSSSKKCAQFNHPPHLHFASVNKLLLFLNFLLSFSVNVHQ